MPGEDYLFLSYRSSETEFALRLAADLRNAGVQLWIDRLDIQPGEDWRKAIQNGMDNARAVLAVLSPDYVMSLYCQRELARADRINYPILPILIKPLPALEWPLELERKQFIDFTEWKDPEIYQARLAQLVSNIQVHFASMVSPAPDEETRYLNSLIATLETSRKDLTVVDNDEGDPVARRIPLLPDKWCWFAEDVSHPSLTFDQIRQVRETHRHLALIGRPGSGSVIALEALVLQAAYERQKNRTTAPLPFYCKLTDWNPQEESLPAYFQRFWFEDDDCLPAFAQEHITLYLEWQELYLPDLEAGGEQVRAWLVGEHIPRAVIMACREEVYEHTCSDLMPALIPSQLNVHQAHALIRQCLPPTHAEHIISELFLYENPLSNLAFTPSFLEALLDIFRTYHPNPANVGSVLAFLLEHGWERYRNTRSDRLSLPEILDALALLAHELDQLQLQALPLSQAANLIPERAVLVVCQQMNILAVERGSLRFSDPTFQGYALAVWLSRHQSWAEWLEAQPDAQNISLIALSLMTMIDDPGALLEVISRRDGALGLRCLEISPEIDVVRLKHSLRNLLSHYIPVELWTDDLQRIAASVSQLSQRHIVPVLAEIARSENWETRKAAADILAQLYDARMPGLSETIENLTREVGANAAAALRQLDEAALPTLLYQLNDTHAAVRRNAAWALGRLGDPAGVPGLIRLLHDAKVTVVTAALHALGEIRDPAAIPFLGNLIRRSSSPKIQDAAWNTLDWLSEIAVDALVEIVPYFQEMHQLIRLIQLLRKYPGPDVTDALVHLSYSENVEIRAAALESLDEREDEIVMWRLLECLQDRAASARGKICDIAAALLKLKRSPETADDIQQSRAQEIDGSMKQKKSKSANIGKDRLQGIVDPKVEEKSGQQQLETRLAQIEKLRKGDPQAALAGFKKLVSDADSQVRLVALHALADLQTPRVTSELINLLLNPDANLVKVVKDMLRQRKEKAVPELLEIVQDEKSILRGVAVDFLGQLKAAAAVPILSQILEALLPDTAIYHKMSERILLALKQINTDEALQVIRQWQDEQINKDNILSSLLTKLRNPQAEWGQREEAAKTLREYAKNFRGNQSALLIPKLTGLLNDPDWVVRWAVIEALAWIGDSSTAPVLVPFLKDSNANIRVVALRALAEIGEKSVLDNLKDLLQDPQAVVREACIETIGLLGDERAVSWLSKPLVDPDPLLRLAAVHALAHFQDTAALHYLLQALSDTDTHVRWAVVSLLKPYAAEKDSADKIVSELLPLLEDGEKPFWEEKRICDLAAEVLDKIEAPNVQSKLTAWREKQALSK